MHHATCPNHGAWSEQTPSGRDRSATARGLRVRSLSTGLIHLVDGNGGRRSANAACEAEQPRQRQREQAGLAVAQEQQRVAAILMRDRSRAARRGAERRTRSNAIPLGAHVLPGPRARTRLTDEGRPSTSPTTPSVPPVLHLRCSRSGVISRDPGLPYGDSRCPGHGRGLP